MSCRNYKCKTTELHYTKSAPSIQTASIDESFYAIPDETICLFLLVTPATLL